MSSTVLLPRAHPFHISLRYAARRPLRPLYRLAVSQRNVPSNRTTTSPQKPSHSIDSSIAVLSSLQAVPLNVPSSHSRHFSTTTRVFSADGAGVEATKSTGLASDSGLTSSAPIEQLPPTNPLDFSNFESSASSKWAVDAAAASTDLVTGLPAQGDLASLGLCANTPVGWLQYMIEYVHVHTGLPWWGAIVVSTFILRAVIFPMVMKVQKNGVIMNNINPEIQKLMKKQKEYRQKGNKMLSDQYSHKIWNVYQQNNANPLKMAVLPLVQVPLFISFFMAIRRMAAVPVESMKTGGALWFTDLTVPDPYYVLPVLACGSFVASIELGGETGVGNPQTAQLKNIFRLMPIILIPITASFPAGLFMYWLPASFISIGQILLLKVQRVRSFFGITEMVRHPPDAQEESKGIRSLFKDNYNSSMAVAQAKQRRADSMKMYKKLKKNPRPKLYDKPPHLIKESQ